MRFKTTEKPDPYKRIIYWSSEDDCFIGMCPELMGGGTHGNDANKVFRELNKVVKEILEIYTEDKTPLPSPKEIVFENAEVREK